MGPGGVIRTPDQRLRVFVSSTLGELADERAAVRAAIERLRLAPVMFELGARPHPPRALYRAYLEQSNIFIGIYWESYGWLAPDAAVSGIEDEYELASGLPCLVYVKEPAPAREQKLVELLGRVRRDDRVSYKRFQTVDELAELVTDDLALLLTERFETGPAVPVGALRPQPLPVAPTRMVGREREIEALCALIEREDVRLLTLSGVGGIGKTRLAVEVAAQLGGRFEDGVGFADLSSIRSAELVPSAVAAAIGVPQEGTRPVAELLIDRLSAARVLLVLDNFEHVVAAAPFVARLLACCASVKVIVTSRAVLRLRGEREFPVMPLEVDGTLGAPAVRLFVARAEEHETGFSLGEANAPAVVELCHRLEGIPLAIELAAARVRVLPPQALLRRIGDRLDLLTGPCDLPERQRTLRATIDWSYNLLDEQERDLFAALSVFVGGFTIESAQAVCGGDVLDGVSSLIEKSLVLSQERPDVEPRFRMLETVRQYADDRLAGSGRATEIELRMARYFTAVAEQADVGLMGAGHRAWLARLDADVDNLRAAIAWSFAHGEPELFVRLIGRPWIYWWQRGHVPELRPFVEQSVERDASLDPASRALQLWVVASGRAVAGETESALPLLQEVMRLQRERGDDHGVAMAEWSYCSHSQSEPAAELRRRLTKASATLLRFGNEWLACFALVAVGTLALLDGDVAEAERVGQEALEHARAIDSESAIGIALGGLGQAAVARGDAALARARYAESARAFQRIQDREALTYALDGLAAVAQSEGRSELAARTLGAADAARERIGTALYPMMERSLRAPLVAAVRAALGSPAFEAPRARGTAVDPDEAGEEALALTAAPAHVSE